MNLEYYQSLFQSSILEMEKQKKRYNQCALYRTAAALCACGFLYYGYKVHFYAGYALGAASAVLFLLLVQLHGKIRARENEYRALKEVAEEYLDRFSDKWKQFEFDGAKYLSDDFPQAKDLDIFGRHSIYQYLCTASSPYGRDRLASWLKSSPDQQQTIRERQQAVAELAQKKAFSTGFQGAGRPLRSGKNQGQEEILTDFVQSLQWGGSRSAILNVLIWALPFLTLFCLGSAILDVNRRINAFLFVGLAFTQLFWAFGTYFRHSRTLNPIYRFNKCIRPYKTLLSLIDQEEFSSLYLTRLQKELRRNGGASEALCELEQLGNAVAARYNILALIIYNTFFLYDFHCAEWFRRWREKHRADTESWLTAVGEFESLISLSVLCDVKKEYSFPEIQSSSRPTLSFENLKHPLIAEESAVGNDFSLDHRTCIITGSNMSGKTTFLRSIGTNLILAYAGGPVTAKHFSASHMGIFTSMRIEDSVSEGISTFYAELLRIKTIIDHSEQDIPMIALIDEIYKGTNSKDRVIGARETIKRLAGPKVMTMITTHDFELCDLEHDPSVDAVNCHFTETYTDDEILFDYRIRDGRCKTTNAQHLLRMVGILPS